MPEASQFVFTFKEIAEILVRKQGLHEGIWGVYVKFGMQATNVGPNEGDLRPSVIVPILEFGLQKFDKETNLSVDAARVNPKVKGK